MTKGDARFVSLYERHYPSIRAYCRRRTRPDRVDDAVAETFLTAWRKIDDVPAGDEALPWLYAVAYRVLGHQWRGLSRQSKLTDRLAQVGHDTPSSPPPDQYVVARQESRQVLEALARLKPADQELLRLTTWEELAHRDIATVLGISVDAVKQRAARARRSLAREYERLDRQRTHAPAAQKGGAR